MSFKYKRLLYSENILKSWQKKIFYKTILPVRPYKLKIDLQDKLNEKETKYEFIKLITQDNEKYL